MARWVWEELHAGLGLGVAAGLHHFLEPSFFQTVIFLLARLALMKGWRSVPDCFILKIKIERSKCWEMGWRGLVWTAA